MEDRKPLFDRPMDELREAFVSARFAQEDVFGRPDIEEWIKGQYANEVPPNADTDAWRTLLKHDELVDFIHGAAILLLQKYATTLHDLGLPRHEPTGYSHLLPLVEQGLYWGKDNRGIYLHPNPVNTQAVYLVRGKAPEDREHSLTFERAGRNNLKDIHETVLEIMFAEWWRGDPKRDAARQWLCEAADVAIRRERAKAEHDFDTAVAVSADGTKIVHADWVVVTGFGTVTHGHPGLGLAVVKERLRVFPSSAFRDRKILRTERYIRIDPYVPNDSFPLRNDFPTLPVESQIARVLERAERPSLLDNVRSEERQLFVRLSVMFGLERTDPARWKIDLQTTVFITDVRHCPSPLPDGGVEVAV